MTQITKTELIELLNGVEKSTFVHLVTETKVRMNKTNNPFYDKVTKKSSSNFLMGNDYENRVLGNGKKEGISVEENTFEVEELKGKRHISKVVCIDTKTETKHYICVERFDEIKPKVEYVYEGNTIEKMLFESYMVKVSESQKQPQERKVKWLTYGIDSIKQISFNKEQYEVVG
jgi:hypothetical protein